MKATKMNPHSDNHNHREDNDHEHGHFHGHHHVEGHENHHDHHGHGHGHMHGVVDPSIFATERGIWAVKWSFVGLFITAILQIVVVYYSGSIALLADTIHNFGDALTAIPLLFAFLLSSRKPTYRFTYRVRAR